jgi:hypothetical protein
MKNIKIEFTELPVYRIILKRISVQKVSKPGLNRWVLYKLVDSEAMKKPQKRIF